MKEIIDFLQESILLENKVKVRRLRIKAARYAIVEGVLYRKSFIGPLLRCVSRKEMKEVLSAIHSGVCGNHYRGRSLAHKAITMAYLNVTTNDVIKFIWKYIICIFGLPRSLTMDNGTQFNNLKIESFYKMYGIRLNYSPVYHHQANGMVEATNKMIVDNIQRNLEEKKGGWLEELPTVL
ncbi:hypothetical protein UlMin_018929 [Ulmus minor]